MLQDARAGSFNMILTEALDRLSRDQADIATIYKRMQFVEVEIITLSEGRVGIVDIGLRGTMNQLYLVETANKIRRGQHGRVKAGRLCAYSSASAISGVSGMLTPEMRNVRYVIIDGRFAREQTQSPSVPAGTP